MISAETQTIIVSTKQKKASTKKKLQHFNPSPAQRATRKESKMTTITNTTPLNILTSAPSEVPAGFTQITADMRYKGDVTKKMTETEFASIRVRRVLVPNYATALSENGIPAKYLSILSEKLGQIANEFFADFLAPNRSVTTIAQELFEPDFLLAYHAEKYAPKVLTVDDVFAWAKVSSFASRHRAKFNDEARTLAYLGFFNQFADKAGISATLAQLETINGLFTDEDLTAIGRQIKAKIETAIVKMGKNQVALDDIC